MAPQKISMAADWLRDALHELHWSQRGLAEILRCDDRLVRRWISGELAAPPEVVEWLQDLADLHSSLPPPAAWRRRASPGKAAGVDTMADEHNVEITKLSWDWQPSGKVVARGEISATPNGSGSGPITLAFAIPLERAPARNILNDPQRWIVTRLRQALRPSRPAASA
jgi:hypothetical protein